MSTHNISFNGEIEKHQYFFFLSDQHLGKCQQLFSGKIRIIKDFAIVPEIFMKIRIWIFSFESCCFIVQSVACSECQSRVTSLNPNPTTKLQWRLIMKSFLVVLSLLFIQEGQLSVTDESTMYMHKHWLINLLED